MTKLKEQILALRAQNKSYREIATDLGCSRGTVAYHCKGTKITKIVDGKEEVFPKPVKAPVMIQCNHCGNEYKKPWGDKKSDYCSKQCKLDARDVRWEVTRDDSGVVTSQKCTICEVVKPAKEYHFSNRAKGTLNSKCKPCAISTTKQWQTENEKQYEENWKRSSKHRPWIQQKAAKYNISVENLQEMYEKVGGVCEICGKVPESKHGIVVDHCHDSNRVRGLLCNPCNTALGLMKDSPENLRLAALYLEREPVVYSPYERAKRRDLRYIDN